MFKNKTFLGIIVARENSKRLKKKNLKLLLGKPLVYYTIKAAKKSLFLDRVILSSESKNILKIAKKFSCETPFARPKYLSNDNVGATEVAYHAIKKVKKNYDFLVLLQPTSPLRNANDIDKAIIKTVNKKALCLLSVYRSKIQQKFPININKNLISKVRINSKKNNNYYLNGAIYIANVNYFIKKKSFYSKKSIPFFMLKKRSVDVDDIKEFNQAKKYLKK